ncbi:unnamed protein product [Paramecium octaurelia]|uniref:Transmembrane protein n=1 Tax=Paramecium octaurelia TaxID=43137 RepID=A0A8S1YAC6_PAROT|nr:unnamed protein product [Paramecium octaurelia]
MLLGGLTFILFQIIRSQICQDADDAEYEEISISLSNQEIVQLSYNELNYPFASLIICSDVENVVQVVGMKKTQYIQLFQVGLQKVLFLQQYKTTKSRMPRQSSLIIGLEQVMILVRFYWDKEPEFYTLQTVLQDNKYQLLLMDTYIMINYNREIILWDINSKPVRFGSKDLACPSPDQLAQLNNTAFSNNYNSIYFHTDLQRNNLCTRERVDYKCKDQALEIEQEVSLLQVYQDQQLTFSSDNKLISYDLKTMSSECHSFDENILSYDYDLKTKSFVTVHSKQIQYGSETYEINLEKSHDTQVFLTKSFIILRDGLEITLFTKKLRIISTQKFEISFQIIANQLQDQFILVYFTHYVKYLIYETPFFEINRKKSNQDTLMFNLQVKDSFKHIQLLISSDYDNHVNTLNISRTVAVSTIFQGNLLLFQKCQYDELLMGMQEFNQYNKLSIIFSYQVRVFDLDSFKIIFAFSRSFIFLGLIENGNLKIFKKQSIQDEIINRYNTAFQIQDDKINYVHCTQVSCYLYLDIMNTYDQKRLRKIQGDQMEKVVVVSDNNHFYLLISKEVSFYNITGKEISKPEELDAKDVLDIFASPKKKDFVFVLTQTGDLCLYSISFPFQDLISSFSLKQVKILEFVIFEHYFLIFTTDSKQKIICNVYNYKNELDIFLQRKLPLFFFKEIDFDNLQVDYDKNILYIKGELISSNEHVIVAYRIDTRVELSIQFISKLKTQVGFVLPISNTMTLRFENKFNFTSIYQNGDLRTTCLIDKFPNENDDLEDDDEDSSSDSDSDSDKDDTLSLDESYKFSSSSFISISSAGELLILGMQSVYGRRRPQNIDIFQPL